MKNLRDPIHGDIQLSGLEIEIIDTKAFQRLRGIRQLGTTRLVFPGAQHTRFEHSIGTCWLLKLMVSQMNELAQQNGLPIPIPKEEAAFLATAALLHDITHIPFGHTFEDERRILPAHDRNTARLKHFIYNTDLSPILARVGWQKPLENLFLKRDSGAPYRYEMVAGPVCADLLDYLRRDAYFCGLKLDYDNRLLRYMLLEENHLCFKLGSDRGFRHDAWSELIHLLRLRYHLTERVYFHHTKTVSGAMLSRVLEFLIDEHHFPTDSLLQHSDDSLVFAMEQAVQVDPDFAQLMSDFQSRKLYKRVYMVARDPIHPDYPSQKDMDRFQKQFHLNQRHTRTKLERKIARQCGIPQSAVIIYAPETRMNLKEANFHVRLSNSKPVVLASLKNPELEELKNKHRALWKLFLFMSPKHEHCFAKAAGIMEREIGLSNQLSLFNEGQMTFGFENEM